MRDRTKKKVIILKQKNRWCPIHGFKDGIQITEKKISFLLINCVIHKLFIRKMVSNDLLMRPCTLNAKFFFLGHLDFFALESNEKKILHVDTERGVEFMKV